MSCSPSFVRRPARSVLPTGHDSGNVPPKLDEDRSPTSALSLGELVPEVIDPARLRARENLSGE
jgi:hypothetical protein